jgi:hypothetical protein
MRYFTKFRLKVLDFWKKYKKRILIIAIAIAVVLIINNVLKRMPKDLPAPSITFNPHVAVITDTEVPKKYREPIENLVDTYFNYCNNGEYEKAYELISAECKQADYPTLDLFKQYVDYVFQGKKKVYTLQSYSVVNNVYVYDIKITDDFLANGTSDGYYYYDEKLVLIEENDEFKFSIGQFISKDNPNIVVEDDYMKLEIVDRTVEYETETYRIKVTNKTDDKYIILADGTQSNEIKLNLGVREDDPDEYIDSFIVNPGSFRFEEITFTKFYDNDLTSKGIIFGAVRILNNYDYKVGTTQENIDNAVKLYSVEIPLN